MGGVALRPARAARGVPITLSPGVDGSGCGLGERLGVGRPRRTLPRLAGVDGPEGVEAVGRVVSFQWLSFNGSLYSVTSAARSGHQRLTRLVTSDQGSGHQRLTPLRSGVHSVAVGVTVALVGPAGHPLHPAGRLQLVDGAPHRPLGEMGQSGDAPVTRVAVGGVHAVTQEGAVDLDRRPAGVAVEQRLGDHREGIDDLDSRLGHRQPTGDGSSRWRAWRMIDMHFLSDEDAG